MIDIGQFRGVLLHGGFVIKEIQLTDIPMVDAVGREAIAQTTIVACHFQLFIRAGLSEADLSVTLYHEILEAASVAIDHPPAAVIEFNEGDFDRAAHEAHQHWGNASPANLDRLLQFYGFGRE